MKANEQYLKQIYDKYEKEKGRNKMQKLLKSCAAFIGITITTVGVVYGGIALKNYINNASLNPSFNGSIGNVEENKVWVGTFQLAWNELMKKLGGEIEFEKEISILAQDLNKQSFNEQMINSNSYYVEAGIVNNTLRGNIEKNIKDKFNIQSKVLERINWDTKDTEYLIYAILNKKFTFETPFPKFSNTFGNTKENVKYFGLEETTLEETFKQVKPLFYNSVNDFAVKIATKEGEEVILYRTDNITNFEAAYSELENKTKSYTGRKEMIREKDELKVPFIRINADINYDELCNKPIKGTNGAYLKQAVQTVDFELNNYGGNITSEAYIDTSENCIDMNMCMSMEEARYFNFNDKFVLYLKEENKSKPYFALLVDNTDVLVSSEEN